MEAGYSKKEIAEYLHVHPSTITREIQRNGYVRYRVYRPKIVNRKTRVGDYEVDTIVGAAHSQHILTLNDRLGCEKL